MKPFNLEEALAGKPVVTREGRKVLQLHCFKNISKENECISVIIEGYNSIRNLYENGRYLETQDHPNDLFMAEEKIEFWHNVYFSHKFKKTIVGESFNTESEAKANVGLINSDTTYIKTIKIDKWTKGSY